MPTPLSVFLPFNRDCVGDAFVPAKQGGKAPEISGHWLIVQNQGLVVVPDGEGFVLPRGERPSALDGQLGEPLWLGTFKNTPCWVAALPRETALPPGLHRETLVPMQNTRLPDDLLSLGGMAMQALWWESTSSHCPRCGERTERIAGEVSKIPEETWPLIAAHWKHHKSFEGMARHFECLGESIREMTEAPALETPVMMLVGAKNEHATNPADYAERISPLTRLIVAENSGHWIHLDEPELVVNSILEMVERARESLGNAISSDTETIGPKSRAVVAKEPRPAIGRTSNRDAETS